MQAVEPPGISGQTDQMREEKSEQAELMEQEELAEHGR